MLYAEHQSKLRLPLHWNPLVSRRREVAPLRYHLPGTPDNILATRPSNTSSRPPTSHCIAPSCPRPDPILFTDPHQRSLAHRPSPPRSVPSEPSPAPSLQTQATWRSWASTPRFRGPWLQSSIGMAGLAVALVGLFFFTYRSYKMEKYDNLMALYQACASLKQV